MVHLDLLLLVEGVVLERGRGFALLADVLGRLAPLHHVVRDDHRRDVRARHVKHRLQQDRLLQHTTQLILQTKTKLQHKFIMTVILTGRNE